MIESKTKFEVKKLFRLRTVDFLISYPESLNLSGVSDDFAPRFFGDLTGIETKSSVPYINEFRFRFLAGIPLRFKANPLADFVGEPVKYKNEREPSGMNDP